MSEIAERVEEFRGRPIYRSKKAHVEHVGSTQYFVGAGEYFAEALRPMGEADMPGTQYAVLVAGATSADVRAAIVRHEGVAGLCPQCGSRLFPRPNDTNRLRCERCTYEVMGF